MKSLRVVLVDDSRTMRILLGRWLESLGHVIAGSAGDGAEALEVLEEMSRTGELPQVVLLDWNMPVMDGYDCLRAIRSERRWSDVCVVMVTAENDRVKIARALLAGADEYVMKPLDKDVLASKLALLPPGRE